LKPESDLATAFETGGATHRGHVRDRNEDDFILRPDIGLWAVADGMGGHAEGAFASRAVTRALSEVEQPASAAALLQSCDAKISLANAEIRSFAERNGGAIVGTTVAVLLAFPEHFACVWCGDSRIYLVRRGVLEQISRDHTEFQELIDRGALEPGEAENWPNRNVLTRAIGVFEKPETEMKDGALQSGDVFVLCSDGLTAHVEDEEILKIAGRRPPESACHELIDLALSRGGKDNVTVIVMKYNPDGTRRMSGQLGASQARAE
jgi:protein phosphatase